MSTIAAEKAKLQKWIPLWIFDVTLKDEVARYWSTRAVTFGSNNYEAIISEHSSLKAEGSGIYGVDAVSEFTLELNNAATDLNEDLALDNVKGGTIQPRFIFLDPLTGDVTSDAIVYPIFLLDAPTATWPRASLSAHNRWNLARKQLPLSTITRLDRYPFPDSDEQREAAYSDVSSEFYAFGYSPGHGHGNWKSTGPDVPYDRADYDGTREMAETMGLGVRHGGFGTLPDSITAVAKKGEAPTKFLGSANEAKYGKPVPLLFGTVRIEAIVLSTGFPPTWNGNARKSFLLLCDGVNFGPEATMGIEAVLKVLLPDSSSFQEIPNTSSKPSYTGTWGLDNGYFGSQVAGPLSSKYRNRDDAVDFPNHGIDFPNRDLFSGLAYLTVGYPKEFAGHDGTGPKTEVIVKGLRIETWNGELDSTWQWTDNPIWIFVHLLKLLGWSTDQIDKSAAYDAAAYCDGVLDNGKKRFRCNLALTSKVKAIDVLRGVRNCCRMYTSWADDGTLQLRIARSVAGEGGLKFAIDETNIARDGDGKPLIKKFHKSVYETANSFAINFQDEDNDYNVDTLEKVDIENVNLIGERIDGESIMAMLGTPSFDQGRRQLEWMRHEFVGLNEYYQVTCTMDLIEARNGQVGTVTEPRLGLDLQHARIRSIRPGPGETVEIVLQKHSDSAYGDATEEDVLGRAENEGTSPRSVGGTASEDPEGLPRVEEYFLQDDVNLDLSNRYLRIGFTPPPTNYDNSFSSRTVIKDASVAITGGLIPGGQTLFAEVCPRLAGLDGLPSRHLTLTVPAGTDTNKATFTCRLPLEADEYTVRVGRYPGRLFKQAVETSPGTDPFTITVDDISALDGTSLSPDPQYDHARVFYFYGATEDDETGEIRTGPKSQGTDTNVIFFAPDKMPAGSSFVTVIVCSADANERHLYGLGIAPRLTIPLTLDGGNPSGAHDLVWLTTADDPTIPRDSVAWQWNRDTTNFRGISHCMITIQDTLPGEGPFKVERDGADPSFVLEEGDCVISPGAPLVQVTRVADPAIAGKVFLIFTDDMSPDSDLNGNVILSEDTDAIVLTQAFSRGGSFHYVVVEPWWTVGGAFDASVTKNKYTFTYTIAEILKASGGDINAEVWRTPPERIAEGTYFATEYSRNLFGVGSRT